VIVYHAILDETLKFLNVKLHGIEEIVNLAINLFKRVSVLQTAIVLEYQLCELQYHL